VRPQEPDSAYVLDMRDLRQVRTTLFQNAETKAEIFNIYKAIMLSAELESGQVAHRATSMERGSSEF